MMSNKTKIIEEYPLKIISKKNKNGYCLGALTVLFPKGYKDKKLLRNLLLSSDKLVKQVSFCKPKNIRKLNTPRD